jgi:nucleotide-binding universal stress UspA family protein
MNVLVLTSEAINAEQLRDALGGDVDPTDTQVMVVAPALHDSPIKFWFSDADDAIARAEQVSRQTVEQLDEAGVPASADTGESDPLDAVEDTLRTFPADRIVVFTHPEGEQQYREDFDTSELEQRFGVQVEQATVAPAN